jgi:hypothetical protein
MGNISSFTPYFVSVVFSFRVFATVVFEYFLLFLLFDGVPVGDVGRIENCVASEDELRRGSLESSMDGGA